MGPNWLTDVFYETSGGRVVLHAMPLLVGVLCVLAIAYRYYSAFLAARVATLDDLRRTPAHRLNDGQNYHPTNKWVLFGHHFAAISGAGPLIGPVLAIQYGYFPGLLWLVIGVCLAGAVQDMLVLAASVRRDGKSLAEMARAELGPWAAVVVSVAILFIVIIALAGLGAVVVKALGGEEVKLPKGTQVVLPGEKPKPLAAEQKPGSDVFLYHFPAECQICYSATDRPVRHEPFTVEVPGRLHLRVLAAQAVATPAMPDVASGLLEALTLRRVHDTFTEPEVPGAVSLWPNDKGEATLPTGAVLPVPGSSWGTFTIACTIPIALFVGLYMYRIRKGRVVEASLIGAVAVLAATIAGSWIPHSKLEWLFSLTRDQTVFALCAYGFVASVLPVWLLLCPRDYLSSFLKIGTIALLVIGVIMANPKLPCPAYNPVFSGGGPTFPWGGVFPFVFICIMCGSISGFHALVSSGTTPKMINKESDIRPIGYGAMLIEGLVGVVALIAAASLDPKLYYDINIDLNSPRVAQYRQDVDRLTEELGGVDGPQHLPVERRDLGEVEKQVGGEWLRGRTGGAVTLAVGMSFILTDAFAWTGLDIQGFLKYWYHFAIMFEALFILTTIDTGTRIARFLLQETLGKVYKPFEKTDWLPGAVLATLLVTAGWGLLVHSGSIDTIWPMFGIANQLLAVLALALVTTWLVNTGRGRYAPATILPMVFVTATTLTAGGRMIPQFLDADRLKADPVKWGLNAGLTVFVIACVLALLLMAVARWVGVLTGRVPVRRDEPPPEPAAPPPEPLAGTPGDSGL
jgi:carbon starvation protein